MAYLNDETSFRWWEELDQDSPSEPDNAQTRSAEHPDGFSFLMPHADAFWQTWLAFSTQELARLRFLRWRYSIGKLTEWPVEGRIAR